MNEYKGKAERKIHFYWVGLLSMFRRRTAFATWRWWFGNGVKISGFLGWYFLLQRSLHKIKWFS